MRMRVLLGSDLWFDLYVVLKVRVGTCNSVAQWTIRTHSGQEFHNNCPWLYTQSQSHVITLAHSLATLSP